MLPGSLPEQVGDKKEGKSHEAEEKKPEVRHVLQKFEARDQQQVETRKQDRQGNDPGGGDLPEQPYPCHRRCSGQEIP